MRIKQESSLGYFYIVSGKDEGRLYVCKGSHRFLLYPDAKCRRLPDIFKLETISLPPYSVFIGHGYLQHAGAEYLGRLNLRYNVYLVLHDVALQDATVLGFNSSIGIAGSGEGSRADETQTETGDADVTANVEDVKDYVRY